MPSVLTSVLYAYSGFGCWVICRKRPDKLFDALETGNWVATSFLEEPPVEWAGTPIVAVNSYRKTA